MDLFVSDLDGTLLNSQIALSEKTIAMLNHLLQHGVLFTVATARSYESAQEILEPLYLTLPMVLFNGVFIYDPIQKHYLESRLLNTQDVTKILEYFDSHNIQPFVYTVDSHGKGHVYYTGIHNPSENRYVSDRLSKGDKRFSLVSSFDKALTENVISINAIHTNALLFPLLREIQQSFSVNPHYSEDIYARGYHWLELTHPHATKRRGVEYLKKYTGASRLICFGDHLNDLPMFDLADEAYAVSNAHNDVKRVATGTIPSNNEDSVADYIAHRALKSL